MTIGAAKRRDLILRYQLIRGVTYAEASAATDRMIAQEHLKQFRETGNRQHLCAVLHFLLEGDYR